jgi:hypothetical protein
MKNNNNNNNNNNSGVTVILGRRAMLTRGNAHHTPLPSSVAPLIIMVQALTAIIHNVQMDACE